MEADSAMWLPKAGVWQKWGYGSQRAQVFQQAKTSKSQVFVVMDTLINLAQSSSCMTD